MSTALKTRLARLEKLDQELARAATPLKDRIDVYPPDWSPQTAAQKAALESTADILFFGGAAGSLKTETMLVDAARECRNPNLRAIVFRQQFTQMQDIVEKTHRLYSPLGGRYTSSPNWVWTFPSGAKIRLAYMATDNDVFEYLGPRYSFIGFDESTMHSEYQVRNILGRLSSTDRSLRLRMRLASNPGSIGAAWHKRMFLRGACPVHAPETSAKPGKLYWDASWPSDSYPLQDSEGHGFSVAFIPGRLSDHNLLDEKYVYRLRMMSGSLSAAMEQGCWCALAGQYFANWNASRMVIPWAEIHTEWWFGHILSLDFGFGKSHAAAHLHVVLQDNTLVTIAELCEPHLSAVEFAQEVVHRFLKPEIDGNRRKVIASYLDPSCFNESGIDVAISVGSQINSVLGPWEAAAIKAANDRIGGWQLMYQMLQTGQWKIADTCPRTIEAIQTRMHDEKKPGDVKKVPGDLLDDLADSVRYGVFNWFTAAEKPLDIVMRERTMGLDLNSAYIRGLQMRAEAEGNRRPITLGRRRRW